MEAASFSIEDQFLIPSYARLPMAIERGEGNYVWDQEGRRYLDLYGGHAVAIVGHSHPRLVKALTDQASRLFFYSTVAYSMVRGKAAQALTQFVGDNFRIFFSNSGAEANENALKVAQLFTGRKKFISMEGSFHGRTLGAISVTGIPKYRPENAPNVSFVSFGDLEGLKSQLNDSVAAVIIEPIQSLSGVCQVTDETLQKMVQTCHEAGALVIIDEIQTGLGRCGRPMFFHERNLQPDIVTMAKGLAGGFPIGATLARKEIAEKIPLGALGSTFGGGPLASALVYETLSIIKDESLVRNAHSRGEQLRHRLKEMPGILEIRGEGLLFGFKCKLSASVVMQRLKEKGILVGTSLDPEVVRLLPPLTVTESEVDLLVEMLEEIL